MICLSNLNLSVFRYLIPICENHHLSFTYPSPCWVLLFCFVEITGTFSLAYMALQIFLLCALYLYAFSYPHSPTNVSTISITIDELGFYKLLLSLCNFIVCIGWSVLGVFIDAAYRNGKIMFISHLFSHVLFY